MNPVLTNALNALALFALGFLVMLQTDEYGELLVNGYHGLGAVCFALYALSFVHAQRAIRAA
jgi:hypothetical protein